MQIRPVLINSALVIFSSAVALLLLEFAVRVLSPQQLIVFRPDVYVPVEGLGYKLKENNNTIVNRGERDVHLITDENGYRTSAERSSDADISVLAVGDSFLEALQVEFSDTMTARLENTLSLQTAHKVRIINTGVAMYNPNHYLMIVKKELAESKHKLVLVFVYLENDIIDERVNSYPPRSPTVSHSFRAPSAFSTREFKAAILYPINDILERRSHLFILFKDRARSLLARAGLTAYYFSSVFKKSAAQSPDWALTADVLTEITTVADSAGIPVLYVLLPAPYQVDQEAFQWHLDAFDIDPETVDLEQPARLLTAQLQSRGITAVDTTPALREAFSAGDDDLYGHIDPHFDVNGHRVVADYLAPLILRYLQ